MTRSHTHLVIMAGGIGSRFWPMSTPECPKQFVDILGTGRTFIQMTFDRFKGLIPAENVWVVTSQAYSEKVMEQLPEVPKGNILLEPCRRNTAPCIAYASWRIKSIDPKATIVVSPSDHLILDVAEFQRVVRSSVDFASTSDAIITLGMKPTRAETGYGYIQTDMTCPSVRNKEIYRVDAFREKPDLSTAEKYIRKPNMLWNAGIFVWNIETIVESLREFTPDLAARMDMMAEAFGTEVELKRVEEIFPTCEKISIDYAVMEKASYIHTIPGDFGWSDVGTWGSLWTLLPHDEHGNAIVGENVHLNDCKGCIVHAPGASSVVLQGLNDCIVVERDGRLLICKLSEEQRIKDFVK